MTDSKDSQKLREIATSDAENKDELRAEVMKEFRKTETFRALIDEWKYVAKYKEQWKSSPFPVTFNTTDADDFRSFKFSLLLRLMMAVMI